MSLFNAAARSPAVSRSLRAVLGLIAAAAVVTACSRTPLQQPFDVGSAAYPPNLPQGTLQTIRLTGGLPAQADGTARSVPLAQEDSNTRLR